MSAQTTHQDRETLKTVPTKNKGQGKCKLNVVYKQPNQTAVLHKQLTDRDQINIHLRIYIHTSDTITDTQA